MPSSPARPATLAFQTDRPTAPSGDSAAKRAPVRVCTLAEAEDTWRRLEAESVGTPYDRLAWCRAFASSEPAGTDIRVAIGTGRDGDAAFLLPLAIRRNGGLRVGAGIGGKHANMRTPLVRAGDYGSLTAETAQAFLRDAGRALGLDLLALDRVPATWAGRPNPFAATGRPSPDDVSALPLEPTGEATLARSMKSDARKKLRSKLRHLEKLGPVSLLTAANPAEVERLLAAFLEQKGERFRELGIADPFGGDEVKEAIRSAALTDLERGDAALELHGLLVGDAVAAVLGGAVDRDRFAGMFLSFASGETSRYSPGEALVTSVVRAQCERGRRCFDLGVGEARYKSAICDVVEHLVDVQVAVSARGAAYARARSALLGAKRRLKASPAAMSWLGWARRRAAALRG